MINQIFRLFVVLSVFLGVSVPLHAALITIGTATYNSSSYQLIYDDNFGITWLDYSNAITDWWGQTAWADSLNVSGVLTYNLNPGVTVSWAGSWRLASALNQDGSGPCLGYNCTGSEIGHLYYTELGNTGYGSPGWNILKPGDFQNLNGYAEYWMSPSIYVPGQNVDSAWAFDFYHGGQGQALGSGGMGALQSALAVREASVTIVPVPGGMLLFGSGLLVLIRNMRQKKQPTD